MVGKSGVKKSGVEVWGWKVRGWDDLQPKIYGLYSNGIQYSRARDDSASTVATWINLSLLQILIKLKIGKWQMQNQKLNLDLECDFKTFFGPHLWLCNVSRQFFPHESDHNIVGGKKGGCLKMPATF